VFRGQTGFTLTGRDLSATGFAKAANYAGNVTDVW
jgi:hypothetical protein